MIRRALIDINVLLDVLAHRVPFADSAGHVWSAVESGRVRGLVSANSFTTVYYLLRRASNHSTAFRAVKLVRDVFEIIPVDAQVIQQAIESPMGDFEDAVQYHSAVRSRADCIVTRDVRHFRGAELPVIVPGAFLASLEEGRRNGADERN